MKQENRIMIAAVSGAIAVAAGALGAHGLESQVSPEMLDAFQTGARYHLLHSLLLLLLGFQSDRSFGKGYMLIGLGVILFSGSLYGLALSEFNGHSPTFLGPLTPVGGLLLISGWLSIAYSAYRIKKGR